MIEEPRKPVFNNAKYAISAAKVSQCPADTGFEVAFAGRSNAGKSSALNTLTRQPRLARTSKTPGRTQLLNFFNLTEDQRLVDLPGYGYAKVPESVKLNWEKEIMAYFIERRSLQGLVLVMDSRRPLTPFDSNMVQWCQQQQLPLHLLLTKSDKLKKGPANAALLQVEKAIAGSTSPISAQLFSSLKRQGVDTLETKLNQWLIGR
ncbi:MAG: GTP-binding protein [Pseudomonadales bacterium]|jgi:GTP-binding protein